MNILSNNTKEEKTLKSIYCFMKEYWFANKFCARN
jgi:hypothetical protein